MSSPSTGSIPEGAERRAVLDLGSNTAKLLVADAGPAGALDVRCELAVPCRLGEGLERSGGLSQEAQERAMIVIGELLDAARAEGAARIEAVATSALRSARNATVFLDRVRHRHGVAITVLTGAEEAEGVFRGVVSDPFFRERRILIMDLGGGSAEWIEADGGRLQRKSSVDVGCVRMTEQFLPDHPVKPGQRAALEGFLADKLRGPLAGFRAEGRTAVATGGTVCALAALRDPEFLEKARAGGRERFTLDEAAALVDELAGMTLEAIDARPAMLPKRADVVVAGGITLVWAFRALGATEFFVSTRNLRYGRLLGM